MTEAGVALGAGNLIGPVSSGNAGHQPRTSGHLSTEQWFLDLGLH